MGPRRRIAFYPPWAVSRTKETLACSRPHEGLHEIQCRKLLADHHLGRLALVDAEGPVIVPVNYLAEVTGRRGG